MRISDWSSDVCSSDLLDVATLTREYIEALGGVHDGLRKLLNGALAEWKSTVRDAIARYVEINGGNAIGLSVAEFNENGTVKSHINIFDDLLLRLERLTRRNGSLINLRRRYVTNELLPPNNSRTRKTDRKEIRRATRRERGGHEV